MQTNSVVVRLYNVDDEDCTIFLSTFEMEILFLKHLFNQKAGLQIEILYIMYTNLQKRSFNIFIFTCVHPFHTPNKDNNHCSLKIKKL